MLQKISFYFVKIINKMLFKTPKKVLLGRWNLKYNHTKYYENKNYPY